MIDNGNGPRLVGSKGIDEDGLLPVASEVADAGGRVVGVRVEGLPLSRAKVWRALQEKAAR